MSSKQMKSDKAPRPKNRSDSKSGSNYNPNFKKTDKQIKEENEKASKQLIEMCHLFWEMKPYIYDAKQNIEMEAKFNTLRGSNNLGRNDYDNVIKQLYSLGFKTANTSGEYLLRIQTEYLDSKKGGMVLSNIRTEIAGTPAIQQYCQNNDLVKLLENQTYGSSISIEKKGAINHPAKEGNIDSVSFYDFDFRTSLSKEEKFNPYTPHGVVKGILDNWTRSKKTFRYINRVTFVHDDYPVKVDLSIVKTSKMSGSGMERTYTTSESNVFFSNEIYEIEIEIDNTKIGPGTICENSKDLLDMFKRCIKYVMMGIQESNYPIPNSEKRKITKEYYQLIKVEDENLTKLIPKFFIGPSSYTLQVKNIVENKDDNIQLPNIRKNFTVTDKADGERRLMYISASGKIYFINTNMKLLFSGCKTKNEKLFRSIIDGEIITHDKHDKYINLFAAFDLYFLNKQDVRHYRFYQEDSKEKDNSKCRLRELQQTIDNMNVESVLKEKLTAPLRVSTKQFFVSSDKVSIFSGCSTVLKRESDGLFEYNTDGLIFTPSDFGVGSDKIGQAGPLSKITWEHSFKWKPSKFNTIDFLVSVKKGEDGKQEINTIFDSGINAATVSQYKKYKTLVLRCGFNEKLDGFINPFQDLIDDKTPEYKDFSKGNDGAYMPMQFYPTDPYDKDGGICNIVLRADSNGDDKMYTEENEVFDDNMIVEFRYEMSNETGWRWIPLRVRYDKTAELMAGKKQFGNAYKVANSNWHSIHYPITEQMISTGKDLPSDNREDDIYYNKANTKSYTRGLRDFHNLYVKMLLIKVISSPDQILIDVACGKAGDLSKWINAKLSFVFGVDLSPDNIENRLDGACARYLKLKRENKRIPGALFVIGNSGYNIRSGEAMKNEKSKQITKSVFGSIAKDKKLGKAVEKYHGIGENGFDVCSCQFAVHYFFQDKQVLNRFLKNVAECTKLGGYFIGTCYDGKKIFNKLKNKKRGEEMELYVKTKKIWGVKKLYDEEEFLDDNTSLGYTIKVFQETINKSFDEFLVNFDYFTRHMENYGFQVVNEKDAQELGVKNGTGSFEDLYTHMTNAVKANPRIKNDYGTAMNMSDSEKEISFYNRYFIFKKVSNVNIDNIIDQENERDVPTSILLKKSQELLEKTKENKYSDGEIDEVGEVDEVDDVSEIKKTSKKTPVKKKLVLKKSVKDSAKETAKENIESVKTLKTTIDEGVESGEIMEPNVSQSPKASKPTKLNTRIKLTG